MVSIPVGTDTADKFKLDFETCWWNRTFAKLMRIAIEGPELKVVNLVYCRDV